MKFVGAYRELEELAAEIEKLKQLGGRKADEFLIITIEDHVSEVKKLTQVPVETPENTNLSREELLAEENLDEPTVDRYAETIKKGGYVLLDSK